MTTASGHSEAKEAEIVSEQPTFNSLINDSDMVKALEKLGITIATPVQSATIPAATADQDLIVQAQTGSGKTLAFVLPLLAKLKGFDSKNITFGLIITPTRELANQIKEVINSISPDIKPALLIGGASIQNQIDDLGRDRRVVVGTPGRILDFLKRREIMLRKCRYFVLDEADEMLSMGFLEDVRTILARLPDKRQGLFLSATITPRVQMLSQSFLTRPKTLVIETDSSDVPDIEHLYCQVGGEMTAKASVLCDLVETLRPRSAIIFCNTRSDTELVEAFLRRRGFDACRINSDLSQNHREAIMKRIREGRLQLLVATDVAARGIDIEQLDIVFNYAIHDQHETYVHRTGRTGRAGRSGKAISIVGPHDFVTFYALSKKMTIEKIEPPTQEDVNEARLMHFYELVRDRNVELNDKDLSIAKNLLKDMADLEEPNEEIVEMVAKLYSLALENIIKTKESEALPEDDRIASPPKKERRQSSGPDRRQGGSGNRSRGGSRGGGRRRD